jgi:hypothetical protein
MCIAGHQMCELPAEQRPRAALGATAEAAVDRCRCQLNERSACDGLLEELRPLLHFGVPLGMGKHRGDPGRAEPEDLVVQRERPSEIRHLEEEVLRIATETEARQFLERAVELEQVDLAAGKHRHNPFRCRPHLAHARFHRLRGCRVVVAHVRRRRDRLGSVGGRVAKDLHRLVEILRAVVDAGKYVRVEVDHGGRRLSTSPVRPRSVATVVESGSTKVERYHPTVCRDAELADISVAPCGETPLSEAAATLSRSAPRISVLIPFFNDGETLPAALASVRQQEGCEIIVVDDGSDDSRSIALLEEVAGSGVILIRQANEGPFSARRAALTASSAPYVFALDADDLVAPGAFTALADALDKHPAAVAAWGDVMTFGDASVFQRGPRTLDPWLMTYMDELTGASTLIRREQLLETGWQIAGFENWDLWLSFCERGWQGVYVPGVVLRYRLHGNGTRRSAHLRRQFPALYSELRTRHAQLFSRRAVLRSASPAPRRLKLTLPIIDMLPLEPYVKHQIGNVIHHPVRPLAVRRDRLRRRFSQQP